MKIRTLIKYKNRHIYDYHKGRYVHLPDLLELVKNDIDFKVIDNQSKKNITNEILLSTLKKYIFPNYIFPKEVLLDVIRNTPPGESILNNLFNKI